MKHIKEIDPNEIIGYIYQHEIVKKVSGKKEEYYYNIPAALDIETSSFWIDNTPQETVYLWQFGIGRYRVYGRNIEEYIDFIEYIAKYLEEDTRLVIYVHNLSYEFQHIRFYHNWKEVFARKTYHPIRALTDSNLEYRCSQILTNKSLEQVGKDLKNPIKKLNESFNYNEIRTSETPLTEDELKYSEVDIDIVIALIYECIENDGDISKIPMTSTGYVREDVRGRCFDNENYKSLMRRLWITPREYDFLKWAMAGGFTHANHFHARKVLKNVDSADLRSAYPGQMILQTYPMSEGTQLNREDRRNIQRIIEKYHVIMHIRLRNVKSRWRGDHIISRSRCLTCSNGVFDNGRVISADVCELICTEIDYAYFIEFYKIEQVEILDGYYYKPDKLPIEIRLSTIEYFRGKTLFKGVKGEEVHYTKSKNKLNSIYGMMVTDIVMDKVNYNGNWNSTTPPIKGAISQYNNGKNRFLFYPWGVYVTAYTRARIWGAILECGEDYVYSDTDSVKILNMEKHIEWFENENNEVIEATKELAKELNLPYEYITPKGQVMGTWDLDDGHYSKFKTLGAKRYIYTDRDTGKLHITLAGCNKKSGLEYIKSKNNPYAFFDNRMVIPDTHSGRLIHRYIDEPMQGTVIDRDGVERKYYTRSGVHLYPGEFTLKISSEYLSILSQREVDNEYQL